MIHFLPRYLVLLSWILIGPSIRGLLTVGFIAISLIVALALRPSFQGRTIAFLGILCLMVADSAIFVITGFSLNFLGFRHILAMSPWHQFDAGYAINFGLTLVGGLASGAMALFILFGRSHIEMSRTFPDLNFLEAPVEVKECVNRLSGLAGIAPPEVLLTDSGTPSAFTVRSKGKYTVAVSVGLIESLDDRETEACIAHEISHIKNGDFTVRLLATLAKVALFAKPLSYLLEPAVYRASEFLADKAAAELIRGPDALISALSKFEEASSFSSPSVLSSVCMCNLAGGHGFFKIFDRHPDLMTRIKVLMELKNK